MSEPGKTTIQAYSCLQDTWNRGGLNKGPRNLLERHDTMVSMGVLRENPRMCPYLVKEC